MTYTLHPTFKYTESQKAWITALTSGKYTQGKRLLCQAFRGHISHCCLGVACDVLKIEGTWTPTSNGSARKEYDRCFATLPEAVTRALGLFSGTGIPNDSLHNSLAGINDSNNDFDLIISALCLTPELYLRSA